MPQFKLPAPDTESSSEQLPQPQQLELKPVRRYRLDSRRDEQEPWVDTEINDQAVVAVEMDDGFTLWLRGDDLRRELARPPARGSDSDAWELRRSLPVDNAERGIGEWALKALSIFDFKPPELAALALAKLAERNNGNILKHIAVPSPDDWTEVVTPIPAPANESGPLLLFLHGTFSSTEGSFGKLLANPGAWRSLQATYPGRIYGYEHRTVSESPIDNLLALLDKLPDGARLHLVSHSRGGLLGDLLALASGAASFTDEQIGRFPESQQARLRKLGQQLATKQLHIERFVRVASPSRGTTLASGRLDRWLSVLSYLLSKVPVVGGTLGEGIQEFLLAVIQQRTNPETLPGLEAMMPGSALVGLLNGPVTAKLPGTLAVIAGDIEGAGLWGRLKLLLPDLFFDGQHDLVVNTGSMYGGPIREHGIHVFDQGADVDHFSYFQQRNAGDEVIAGLTRALPIPGFEPITADLATRPARGITPRDYPHQPRRPVLFVLPGIMGSALSVDNKEVWVNVGRLAFGGLGRLQLPPQAGGPAAASSVSATGMLDMAYGDLLEHFSRSHNIVPFPYDWRLSIEVSARLLAETLEPKLARAENDGQPLAILAHSMGGLVARAMIAARPDLWKRIRRHPQGRLVMLGTPNAGSWEIVRLLVGRSSTLKKLALLDLTNNGTELLDIISAFPGVLELLPDDDRELFTPAFWSGLHQQDQAERHLWSPPDHHDAGIHGPSRLAEAGAVRQRLRNNAIDPNGMVYVAGQAPVTPSDVQPTDVDQAFFGDSQTGLAFQASPRGDSQVLWDTGLLPGVPTWYMSGVVHGDLANHQDAFEALRELIDTGNTHALARQAPQTRGVAATFAMPEHEPAFLPDQRSLLSSALGMGPPPQRTRSDQKVRVYITHGDLKSGRHIVAVGHYSGDTIVGPEAYLDRVLDGCMRRSRTLGLYPDALGTHGVFFNRHPKAHPSGALVVGLGKVGELTTATLTDSFSRALLAFCLERIEHSTAAQDDHALALELPVTTLLIGTGAGGIGVAEALTALVHGVVRANQLLGEALDHNTVRITELRVIELWEHTAIQAARALTYLNTDPELGGKLICDPTLNTGPRGKRGFPPDDDPEWWHRLQILAPKGKPMHFTSLTRRARAEQDLLTTQQVMVDRFVTDTVGTVHDNREISRTLFEMLLPNRLKDGAEMRGNLVLVLDQRSARFPWEMLEDRWSDQHRPPSVEYGMIRQLSTQTYRTQLSMVSERRALVVGDPVSKLVPLPGAREEAEAVQARLLDRDYQVKSCIGSESHAIVTALFGDAYQILHLAGHGIHRQRLAQDSDRPQCNACGQQLPVNDEELVSGMVIGQDVVLTANDVEQMRQVPELVFINCCHLARTDSAKLGDSDDNTPVHRLAANLAEAFIRMGVRAVVAAGWAVDDRAANTFATTFYRKMMEGRGFGTAVRLAREQTWNESPNINTWGAYQCYGDPDFTLSGKHDQNGDQSDDSSYVSPLEAQADLDNLRAETGSATLAQTATLAERLAAIETRIDQANHHSGQDWRQHGDLAESLGRTHGELGHFEQAVTYLNSAIAADDAGASCAAVEQRARYHGRWALQLHLHGDIKRATKEFDAAWQALNRVQLNPGDQLTVERYRSLTGIYSRRVQTRPPTDRKEDLEGLITTYDQADQQLRQRPGAADHDPLDLFSQVLWLTAKLMLTAYSQKTMEELCPDFEQRCERLKQRAHDEAPIDSSFQTAATSAEIRLLEELHHGRLNDEIANEVIADLRSAINHGFSQRQQSSLMNNLNLLHTLSAGATVNKRHFHRQAGALARIRDALGV